MRSRGTGWVVTQFALMAAVAVVAVVGPRWPDGARTARLVAGVALLVAGAAVAVWAARALGRALTPFPRPHPAGSLVAHGPFRVVRHPVYAGGLLVVAGVTLLAGPWTLVPGAALALLWALKARVEEEHLRERYGTDYVAYAERVRRRIVPGVY
jgi:protein-S-isoprenylcysteine O-methyltransferase